MPQFTHKILGSNKITRYPHFKWENKKVLLCSTGWLNLISACWAVLINYREPFNELWRRRRCTYTHVFVVNNSGGGAAAAGEKNAWWSYNHVVVVLTYLAPTIPRIISWNLSVAQRRSTFLLKTFATRICVERLCWWTPLWIHCEPPSGITECL